MGWNLEGLAVRAKYMGTFDVIGTVRLSRVKYGGTVSHHITLSAPLVIYGTERTSVIVDHTEVWSVMEARK